MVPANHENAVHINIYQTDLSFSLPNDDSLILLQNDLVCGASERAFYVSCEDAAMQLPSTSG